MSNFNDLYKESGIKPGNQLPQNQPGKPGKFWKRIIVIAAIIILITVILNLLISFGSFDSDDSRWIKVIVIAAIIFGANIYRFIMKLIRKNKITESYKEQT